VSKNSSVRGAVSPRRIGDVVQQLDDLVDFEPMLHQLRSQIEDVVNDAPEWLWEDLLHFSGAATLVHGRYLPWILSVRWK
jgi:hypothetical protein